MRGVLILLGVFTLDERESDIAFKWLVGKFHVLFTPSDDKDQKKFSSSLSLSVNGPRARSQWEGCIQSKSTWLMFIYLFSLRR